MDDLFRLIKSMDTEEKRYFRRFGLKDDSKGKSQTEKLFDLLEQMETFDEDQLNYRLKREKLDKQIASLKSYLTEKLLDSLLWYRKSSFPGLANSFELAKIGMLEERGLQEEADRLMRRLSPSVAASESFTDRWNILAKRISNASNAFLSDRKVDFEEVNTWLQERAELLQQMERFNAYDSLLMQQLKVMRKAMLARNEQELAQLNQLFESNLVQDKQQANSAESLFIFYTLRIHHFSILQQPAAHFNEALALVNYFKEQSGSTPPMRLLWAYAQLTQACYNTARWIELEQYLKELQQIQVHSQTERMAGFIYHTQLAITLYDYKRDEDTLLQIIKESQPKLKEFGNRLRPDIRLSITITMVSALVEYGYYNEAVALSEDFLTYYEAGIRLDALLLLHAYELVAHLETGNMVYVNNTVRNIHRYFQRHDYKGPFETALMNAFRKLSEISDYKAYREDLLRLHAELSETAKAAEYGHHMQLLPLIQTFVLAKMEGQAIHRYVQAQRNLSA